MLQAVLVIGLCAAGLAYATAPGSVAAVPSSSGELWAALDGPTDSILERREKPWNADAHGYVPLHERPRTLNRLLDKAVAILSTGDAVELRGRIADLRGRIAERERQVAALRAGLASLPEDPCDAARPDSSAVERQMACWFARSREDQAARIAEARRDIGRMGAEVDRLQAGFTDALAGIGIRLSPDQVDGLLRLSTAEDIVAAHAVYDNLRRVNEELLTSTVAADEAVEVARRYYGVYTVLLEIALHLHERFLDTVKGGHLPRLDSVVADARAARAEAQALASGVADADGTLKAQLRANIDALDLTLEAAALYRRTLEDQIRAVEEAWRRVSAQHAVAVNTWRTVRASADLMAMMNDTGRSFETVLALDLPPPRPFANRDLQREFERLTLRLTAAER